MKFYFALLALLLCSALANGQTQYRYEVVDTKPQSRDNFVQGLEILDGTLYLSSGGYGNSRMSRYRFEDGSLIDKQHLHPKLFAEGLTVFKGSIYLLTWRSRLILVMDKSDLTLKHTFKIPGEGWGMTHNEEQLIYSDGSHRLHFLAPDTEALIHSIDVTENGQPVNRLNELEWIDGQIWANIWQQDRIVIIDPATGEVTGSIDLTGLLPAEARQRNTDVLNGIARDPATGNIWVTGKRWPFMYQIRLIKVH